MAAAATLTGHAEAVRGLCWVSDNRVVSCSSDRSLKLWSVSALRELGTFDGHTEAVCGVCWLGDHRIASGSADTTVKIWDVETRECLSTIAGHLGAVYCVAALSGGRLVSGSGDKSVKVWSVDTAVCLGICKGHTRYVSAVLSLEDARIVSASGDGTLRLWDGATYRHLGTFAGHRNSVNAVAAASGNRIVSTSKDSTLKLWNVDTQECLLTFNGHSAAVGGVTQYGTDGVISCGGDMTLRLWDPHTGACSGTLATGHTEFILRVIALPDGCIVTASEDKTLKLWRRPQWERPSSSVDVDSPMPAPPPIPPAASLPQMLVQTTVERDAALAQVAKLTADSTELRAKLAQLEAKCKDAEALSAALQNQLSMLEVQLKAEAKRGRPYADASEALDTQATGALGAGLKCVLLTTCTDLDTNLRLQPVKKIGDGQFGTVFLARPAGSDASPSFALKYLRLRSEAAGVDAESKIAQESRILSKIVHPNIVRYHTIYAVEIGDPLLPTTTAKFLCIGMDLCQGGTFGSLTASPDPATMHELCLQTMQGVAVLHSQLPPVRHGDIKPDNICLAVPLASGAVHVKLIDFGLADDSTLSTLSAATGGSKAFWSPERWTNSGYNIEDDVWAAAVSLLFVGVGLCSNTQIAAALGHLTTGDARYQPRLQEHLAKFRELYGPGLATVLAACLVGERKQRCSARAACVVLRDMHVPAAAEASLADS